MREFMFFIGLVVVSVGIATFIGLLVFIYLEWARKYVRVFKYVSEYIYYRKHFKKWFEKNKGKKLNDESIYN